MAVSGLGYFAAQIDRADDHANMAKYAYDVMAGIITDIHAGKWGTGQ